MHPDDDLLAREAIDMELFNRDFLLKEEEIPSDVTCKKEMREFGKFKIIKQIGRGGLGEVYLAEDTIVQRKVALKLLTKVSAHDIERFQREARLTARLNHPNIVQVYEAGRINDIYFISMQYIDGKSLEEEQLEIEQALRIIYQIALAVNYAHNMNIIHRDIKPANILIDAQGRVYLTDFGIAKQIQLEKKGALSVTGMIIGTPCYMSPEQARGEIRIDERVDVYSLGATLYYLVTRSEPYKAINMYEIVAKVLSEELVEPRKLNKDVLREVKAIIMKAMQKEREKRYWSAKHFADDIDRFLRGEPVSATKSSIMKRFIKKLRKHKGKLVSGVLLLITVALILFAIVENIKRLRQEETYRKRIQDETMIRAKMMQVIESINEFDRQLLSPPFDITSKYYLLNKAIKLANETLKIQADLHRAYYELARAYARKQDYEKALKSLNKVLSLKDEGLYYYERGMLYYKQAMERSGKEREELKAKAISDLRKAIEKGGLDQHRLEHIRVIIALEERRWRKAFEIIKKQRKELEKKMDLRLLPEILILEGFAYIGFKDYNKAIQAFERAYNIHWKSDLDSSHIKSWDTSIL